MKNLLTASIIFTLLFCSMMFYGCPQDNNAQNQLIAKMQAQLEIMQKQKDTSTPDSYDWNKKMEDMAGSMKKLAETLESNKSAPAAGGISEDRFNSLAKEVLNNQTKISQLLSDSKKYKDMTDQIERLRKQIEMLKDSVTSLESDTLKNLNKSLVKLLKDINSSFKTIADTIPAEYSRQLQTMNKTLTRRVADLEKAFDIMKEELDSSKAELLKKDVKIKGVTKRYDDLKNKYEFLRKTGKVDDTTSKPDKMNGRKPDINLPGVLEGKVLVSKLHREGYYTVIVQFPKGLNIKIRTRFNVFDNRGKKIGFFEVTSTKKTSKKGADFENYGGRIRLFKGEVLAKGDRVTTLFSVPDLMPKKK